jgi:hypothetical protein
MRRRLVVESLSGEAGENSFTSPGSTSSHVQDEAACP